MAVSWLALVATLVAGAAVRADGQALKIGVVDFYGLNKVSPGEIRKLLTFKEGDTIMLGGEVPAVFRSSEERLARVPGVIRVRFEPVCCDSGAVVVFVGIQEQGASTLHLRPVPTGAERLPADLVQASQEFSKAMMSAIRRGDAGEDRSQGHSLMHDPAARAIQERFVEFARRDLPLWPERRGPPDSGGALHRVSPFTGVVGSQQGVFGADGALYPPGSGASRGAAKVGTSAADDDANARWGRGDREAVIQAALGKR